MSTFKLNRKLKDPKFQHLLSNEGEIPFPAENNKNLVDEDGSLAQYAAQISHPNYSELATLEAQLVTANAKNKRIEEELKHAKEVHE